MNDFSLICFSLFFAVAPIFLSLFVRESVKKNRQKIIADLEKFFKVEPSNPATAGQQQADRPSGRDQTDDGPQAAKPKAADDDDLLHSFEFVKFKYHVDDRGEAAIKEDAGEPRRARAQRSGRSRNRTDRVGADFMADEWMLAALPLMILMTFVNGFAILALVVSFHLSCADLSVPKCVLSFIETHRTYRYAMLAAYAGAYVYMIRAFFQAINNFDLTPASFFGALINLIFGLTLPQVVFFYVTTTHDKHEAFTLPALIVAFFVGGYMPDAVLRWVLQLSAIRYFKGERFDFGRRGESIPVEVLDGIDSMIRYRLTDFHITTVQNLAAANPIMLFVETPFGIYQMIDWVAQAQLCASVGPDRLFSLWDLGIRTIFDLERVALHKEFQNNTLLWAIENALFGLRKTGRYGSETPGHLLQGMPAGWDPEPIKKSVTARIDCAHTHRLRQIVNRVGDQIGGGGTRFLTSVTLP